MDNKIEKNQTFYRIFRILSLISVVFCLFIYQKSQAQRKEVDSLLKLVRKFEKTKNCKKDTVYIRIINLLSKNYYTISPDSALLWAEKGLLLSQAIDFKKGIIDALRYKGIVFRTEYSYPKALDLYFQALKIAEQINDIEKIGSIHNSIAIIYKNQKKYKEALENYHKALAINKSTKDERGLSIGLNNIAIVLNDQGKYEEALKMHFESLEIRKKGKDNLGISNSLNNIGDVYFNLKDFQKAKQYYEEAEQINSVLGNNRGLASDLSSLANTYLKLNQPEKVINCAKKSILAAQKVGYLDKVRDSYEILSKVHQIAQRYDSAFFYYQQFKIITDSIQTKDNQKKTERLLAEYEFGKKELELKAEQLKKDAIHHAKLTQQRFISLGLIVAFFVVLFVSYYFFHSRKKIKTAYQQLTLANEEILQKNEEINSQKEEILQTLKTVNEQKNIIEEQNLTKDKLFAIIGHDLRSPINSLKGLMNLVTNYHITPDEFKTISAKLKNGVEYVHFTLNNLLYWANTQMQGIETSPSSLHLFDVVKESCNLYSEIAENKNVQISNEVRENSRVWADPDHVSLIIRNLISNAIKFSNEKGLIRIQAELVENNYQISISDNGIGMSEDMLKKIFDSSMQTKAFGTKNEKGTGLGLKLCKDFVEKNGGRIWVESELGVGSQFYFTLPYATLKLDS